MKCIDCGIRDRRRGGLSPTGRQKYKPRCTVCDHKKYGKGDPANRNRRQREKRYPYTKFKKGICERCGFVAKNMIQMDVHHRDHNHANDDPTNLETLCANCHRLEHA